MNVSPKQVFELGFDEKVICLVEQVGIALSTEATLELTENILIKDLHIVEPILKARDYGFGISLDDFGTGFSSSTTLIRFNHRDKDRPIFHRAN
ncbi:hypothetical protein OH492_15770 [Vibrio chagasii]|nr:hypothetical protein [Vibrio chagasii]